MSKFIGSMLPSSKNKIIVIPPSQATQKGNPFALKIQMICGIINI